MILNLQSEIELEIYKLNNSTVELILRLKRNNCCT
jgi:hypothetical protein